LAILRAREKGVQKVLDKASRELEQLSTGPEYKDLLVRLMIQALNKMEGETEILVQHREEDQKVVAEAIEIVKGMREKDGRPVQLSVDKTFLAPSRARASAKTLITCSGGIVLSARGRVFCDNTLDVRLKYAYERLVPQIRQNLFGQK